MVIKPKKGADDEIETDEKERTQGTHMIFSNEEVFLILKKALPNADVKELDNIAQSIKEEGEHWQEADLNEHIHDELETKVLEEICRRESNQNNSPKAMRLFFK